MKTMRVCAKLNVHQDLPFNRSMSECSLAVQKNGHGEPGAQLLDPRGERGFVCVGVIPLSPQSFRPSNWQRHRVDQL